MAAGCSRANIKNGEQTLQADCYPPPQTASALLQLEAVESTTLRSSVCRGDAAIHLHDICELFRLHSRDIKENFPEAHLTHYSLLSMLGRVPTDECCWPLHRTITPSQP